VKNGAAKTLKLISERKPAKLYPQFGYFADLLDSDDTILKWIAIDVIGNLSFVDSNNQIIEGIINKFYCFLSDESMITAGHAIDNLSKIALNKPRYRKEITAELLQIDITSRNDECRNILIGKAILAFDDYLEHLPEKEKVLEFAKRHLNNSRKATKKKAEKFLIKFMLEYRSIA
jgi:hypothetical protein